MMQNMPNMASAVVTATSAGKIGGSNNGFATVSDLTRKQTASSSVLIAAALLLLTKFIVLVCNDDDTGTFIPSHESASNQDNKNTHELFRHMMNKALRDSQLSEKVSKEVSKDGPIDVNVLWRKSFLGNVTVVLENSFGIVRRHKSWRVRCTIFSDPLPFPPPFLLLLLLLLLSLHDFLFVNSFHTCVLCVMI
jgi:hypothetical protein